MTDLVLTTIRNAGYAIFKGSKFCGNHAVSLCRSGRRGVYCVGVDHTLPQSERDALWAEHTPKIIAILTGAGYTIRHGHFNGDNLFEVTE